ncbi:MAG: TetR/AcrR family transcriptional regulator [Spirochaetales bacterium]|jgi:AcrR family transcriptional regulator|nr:TetR/AcrR family transcriptional regulator [Spirochaetales bacterium]
MPGKTKAHDAQIEQSRAWIFEALIRLLDKKPWHKINISDITKTAGVARQTFYRHYTGKDAVILGFLEDCFRPNHIKIDVRNEGGRDTLVVVLPWRQFIKNAAIMKKIFTSGAEYLIYVCAKEWEDYLMDLYKDKLSGENKIFFSYMIKYANGGALRIICDWIKNDMPISAKKIGSLIAEQKLPFEKSGGAIPKITLLVK